MASRQSRKCRLLYVSGCNKERHNNGGRIMSRDFELLQRVEQERGRPRKSADAGKTILRTAVDRVASNGIEQQPIAAKQVTAGLAPAIRNELVKLVQRVFLSTLATKIVMFTGVEAGECAKWLTACTAEILADARCGNVCLLDADLAAPSLHRHFGIGNQKGLCDALWKGIPIQEVTQQIGENLWVVPSGPQQEAVQITPSTFQAATVDLLGLCDYVLISAPECDHYATIGSIGVAVQGAILVLDATRTRRIAAQSAKAALDAANIRVLGSVFHNRSFPIPEFLYSRL
jgi:Mrp family chromosome partitioning ATPase